MERGNAWHDPGAGRAAGLTAGCDRFLAWHSAYLDDELTPAERAAHEAHEAACPPCARYASVLRQGTGILRELPDIDPSPDFEERLQHRIFHVQDEAALAGERRRRRTGWLVAAAAAAVVVAGPLLLDRPVRRAAEAPAAAADPDSEVAMTRLADGWQTPPVPLRPVPTPLPPGVAGYSPVVVRAPQYQPVSYQLLAGE